MDFILGCGCLRCPLTSGKGTYNTYDRERKQVGHKQQQQQQQQQASSFNEHLPALDSNNNNNSSDIHDTRQWQAEQHQREETADRATTENTTPRHRHEEDHSKLPKASEGMASPNRGASGSSKQQRKNDSTSQKVPPVLSQFNLDGIAELINNGKCSKSSVIVLVGAGMSTAAGVPDFRSPTTGIYANLQKYNLPHPEDVFKIDYFKNNPAPFYDLSRQILPDKLFPTLSHYFVRLLHEKGYLLRCYSQNVDCLESLCGLPKDKLCLAHGSFETGHCLRCNAEYSLAWMRQIVEQGGIPHCTKTPDCKGLIKPDVKFFGERLDGRFFRLAKQDFPKCELLIIIGSSLTVMPFAQLVQKVPATCPRLLINKTKSGHDLPLIFRLFRSSDGLMYDKKGNTRDVAFIGDCDDACVQLCTKLGWNGDLIEMARLRRQQLDQQHQEQQQLSEAD